MSSAMHRMNQRPQSFYVPKVSQSFLLDQIFKVLIFHLFQQLLDLFQL